MKNRGYTLLELLGVIVILALLTTLVFPSILNTIKKSSNTIDEISMDLISNAADLYIDNHADNFIKYNGNKYIIELEDLLNEGNLPDNIKISDIDDINDKCVQVTYNDGFNYELKNTCEHVVYLNSICKLVSDSDGSSTVTAGDKYSCKVDLNRDPYTFFVLTTPETNATQVNLIMDRNIYYNSVSNTSGLATSTNTGLISWIGSYDYKYAGGTQWSDSSYTLDLNMFGPITAMNYLYNATKTWTNIPNIQMDYTDEGNTGSYGYGKIVTTDNITKITKKDGTAVTVLTNQEGYPNLKARLPRYDEVTGTGKCSTGMGSCPLWLVNYLHTSSYVTGEGVQNISGISGYWTLSSGNDYFENAFGISFNGGVDEVEAYSYGLCGIRPVITLDI